MHPRCGAPTSHECYYVYEIIISHTQDTPNKYDSFDYTVCLSCEFTIHQKKGWYLSHLTYRTINYVCRHASQLSYCKPKCLYTSFSVMFRSIKDMKNSTTNTLSVNSVTTENIDDICKSMTSA